MKNRTSLLKVFLLFVVVGNCFSQERVAPQIPEETRRQISEFMKRQFENNKDRLEAFNAAGKAAGQGKSEQPDTDLNVSEEVLLSRIGGATLGLSQRFSLTDFRLPNAAERRKYVTSTNRLSILIPEFLYRDMVAYELIYSSSTEGGRSISSQSEMNPARNWSVLANVVGSTGAFDDAERIFGRAFDLLSKLNLIESPGAIDVAIDYCDFLRRQGKYDDALELVKILESRIPETQRVLSEPSQIIKRILSPWGDPKSASSFQLSRIKYIHANIMNALGYFEYAEISAREGRALGPGPFFDFLGLELATAQIGKGGGGKEAQSLVTEALRNARSSGRWSGEGGVLLELHFASLIALALIDQERFSDAENIIITALSKARSDTRHYQGNSLIARTAMSEANYVLAKARRKQGKRESATDAAVQAAEGLDSINQRRMTHGIVYENLVLRVPEGAQGAPLDEHLFRLVQFAGDGTPTQSVANLAERLMAADDTLSSLIRERQDIINQYQIILQQTAGPAAVFSVTKQPADDQISGQMSRLQQIDQRLMTEFPAYASFVTNAPVKLKDVQQVLSDNEAVLGWVMGDDSSWAFVVRKDKSIIYRLGANAAHILTLKQNLRRSLELGSSGPGVFPAQKSNELYSLLIAPLRPALAGVRHLYVAPNSQLADLPISVLLTTQQSEGYFDARSAKAFRDAPWLIKEFSVSVVPSVASMQLLRSVKRGRLTQYPFFGVGNPVLRKMNSEPSSRSLSSLATNRRGSSYSGRLTLLEPLPETADELRKMARTLASSETALLLGEAATEKAVKTTALDDYRAVAFATHGLLANELVGLKEPGLVLTPPSVPTDEDDGVLTASEVATLRLNADWVLLSACNTASGDGRFVNYPLGGLAKSFFFAGAKSLLVSHWKVASQATVDLTTETIRNSAKGKASQRDAHRSAMISMINSGDPIRSHPSIWGAFSLISAGEAGAM